MHRPSWQKEDLFSSWWQRGNKRQGRLSVLRTDSGLRCRFLSGKANLGRLENNLVMAVGGCWEWEACGWCGGEGLRGDWLVGGGGGRVLTVSLWWKHAWHFIPFQLMWSVLQDVNPLPAFWYLVSTVAQYPVLPNTSCFTAAQGLNIPMKESAAYLGKDSYGVYISRKRGTERQHRPSVLHWSSCHGYLKIWPLTRQILLGRILKSKPHFLDHLLHVNYTKRQDQETSTMLPGRQRSHETMTHRNPELPRNQWPLHHGGLYSLATCRRFSVVSVHE